jgi:hypothetical protein
MITDLPRTYENSLIRSREMNEYNTSKSIKKISFMIWVQPAVLIIYIWQQG